MKNSRFARVLLSLAALAGMGLALTGCGASEPAAAGPRPDNYLSIGITDDGEIEVPVQEVFTDKSVTRLRLHAISHGGSGLSDGKMYHAVVTIVSSTRADQSNMSLGSMVMNRTTTHRYANTMTVLLGDYTITIDGKKTNAVIRVSAKTSPSPAASTR